MRPEESLNGQEVPEEFARRLLLHQFKICLMPISHTRTYRCSHIWTSPILLEVQSKKREMDLNKLLDLFNCPPSSFTQVLTKKEKDGILAIPDTDTSLEETVPLLEQA